MGMGMGMGMAQQILASMTLFRRTASWHPPHGLALGLLLLPLLFELLSSSADALPRRRMLQHTSPDLFPQGRGYWSVRGPSFIDNQGREVAFSGVNWFGLETPQAAPLGLHMQSLDWHLDQMAALGFNMIRLPFAGDTLLTSTYPENGTLAASLELQGLTSLGVMDKVIQGCAQRGIKVILDYHRLHLTYWAESGTWFDGNTTEEMWISNWVLLAQRYQGVSTIIGADLFNEMHNNTHRPDWPGGAPYWVRTAGAFDRFNLRRATERVIAAIHGVEPNWIFFIEGTWDKYWWGGNVAKVLISPITWPPGKIAYSTHEYGPRVFPAQQFFAPTFPNNIIPIMRQNWGRAIENGVAPVWVGEFGSPFNVTGGDLDQRDIQVFKALVSYIKKLRASWTIFAWNPGASDSGSILNDDFSTINTEKMVVLGPIMYKKFRP